MSFSLPRRFFFRLGLLVAGLFFSGLGVSAAKYGGLGIPPVSSPANVAALRFSAVSFGSWLLVLNFLLILGQVLILKKDFKLYQLLQIPLAVVFGRFADLGLWLAGLLPRGGYPLQLLWVAAGSCILALGISLCVEANLVMNPGEALVKTIADKTGLEFGRVKTRFDIGCVGLSVVLSLLFFGGQVVGLREGTLACALINGNMVRLYQRLFKKLAPAAPCAEDAGAV